MSWPFPDLENTSELNGATASALHLHTSVHIKSVARDACPGSCEQTCQVTCKTCDTCKSHATDVWHMQVTCNRYVTHAYLTNRQFLLLESTSILVDLQSVVAWPTISQQEYNFVIVTSWCASIASPEQWEMALHPVKRYTVACASLLYLWTSLCGKV